MSVVGELDMRAGRLLTILTTMKTFGMQHQNVLLELKHMPEWQGLEFPQLYVEMFSLDFDCTQL